MQQVKKKLRKKSSMEIAKFCVQAAVEKKAQEPVILDVRKLIVSTGIRQLNKLVISPHIAQILFSDFAEPVASLNRVHQVAFGLRCLGLNNGYCRCQ